MTDFLLVQQLHQMMGQLPRPRLMFRKGIGMKGYFRPYRSFEEYTDADIFCEVDESFAVRARFSSLLGDRGTADTRRNIKGFAVRFGTGAGEYDLLCSSLPVFLIHRSRDFPALAEVLRRDMWFDEIVPEKFWNFVIEHPEALHGALRLFSREGLAASYRLLSWYSVHTWVWSNGSGERFLVRCRWNPVDRGEEVIAGEHEEAAGQDRVMAEFLAGFDPDIAEEDLKRSVASGHFPAWELWVQIMNSRYSTHPEYQRSTVSWNEAVFPPIRAGILKLTELQPPEESEELCFSPGRLGKGIALLESDFAAFSDYAHKAGGAERGIWT